MNQRKAIEAALAEMGITNETQLNDAIRNMKPLNFWKYLEGTEIV